MIFERVVCGVDASEESLEAVRQSARLVSADGDLLLVAVAEIEVAVQAGWAAETVAGQLRDEAEQALEAAEREVGGVRAESRLLEGPVLSALLEEAKREHATLVCVGTHGHRRASGILLGSTLTTVVHDAACSVLAARAPAAAGPFPASIAVGIDGSEQAAAAVEAAAELARRFGSSVRHIVASHGKAVDLEAVERTHAGVEIVDGKPVEALVAASAGADLLVVGSKGLHGVRALGSVSERVAHRARCSVLVVRRP